MIGLLRKDITYLRNLKKNFLLVVLVYFALGMINGNPEFSSIFVLFMTATYAVQPFQYDKYGKWNEYPFALPLSKKEMVLSRYLYGLIVGAVGILISVIMFSIMYFFKGTEITEELKLTQLLYGGVISVLVLEGVLYPIVYYFGLEKGKIVFFVIAMAFIVLILGTVTQIENALSLSWNAMVIWLLMKGALVLAIGIFVASYFLSVKIVTNKNSL